MKTRSDFADVESDGEHPTFESVNQHLDDGLTFARIAQAEHVLGNQEAADHAHTEVAKGYTAAVNELSQVQGLTIEQRHALEAKLDQLRDAITHLDHAA